MSFAPEQSIKIHKPMRVLYYLQYYESARFCLYRSSVLETYNSKATHRKTTVKLLSCTISIPMIDAPGSIDDTATTCIPCQGISAQYQVEVVDAKFHVCL